MKTIFNLLFPVIVLFLFQSCDKKEDENTITICPVTFPTLFKWREDSINADKPGAFNKIEKGHVFTWISTYGTLDKSDFAMYQDLSNIRTDLEFAIVPDSVFILKLIADSVYFYDKEKHVRTDLKGHITYTPDTSLVLYNTAVSPAITIKYKREA